MIDKSYMMDCVSNQLAIDYNCAPDDFHKDGLIFTEARECEGRRPFPWILPRLEMISMGNGVIINASADVMPYARRALEGKTRDEVFWSPFAYGVNPYFLPDLDEMTNLQQPDGFVYEIVKEPHVQGFYEKNGLPYDAVSPFKPALVALARNNDKLAGIARASADCQTMWQIGVDVLSPYRGQGVASALVNMLTLEILERGIVPYYFTSVGNVISMRAAVRAGYIPAWVHCYKTRMDALLK